MFYRLRTEPPKPSVTTPKKEVASIPEKPAKLDLKKLSYAVSCAETSCGKDGTALKRNNLHGIMCYKGGKRSPCYFKSPEESHKRFQEIWSKNYKKFPDLALARKWTGNDNAETWLKNVEYYYYK